MTPGFFPWIFPWLSTPLPRSHEEWLTLAKFLARCRDRQAAAEEALCQAG